MRLGRPHCQSASYLHKSDILKWKKEINKFVFRNFSESPTIHVDTAPLED
jgi:hypothetical protein